VEVKRGCIRLMRKARKKSAIINPNLESKPAISRHAIFHAYP
jgi:hypothetical protein